MVDKFTFFIGVLVVYFDAYVMGKYPDDKCYTSHLVLILTLVGWRHINYRYNRDHYFLFDFCYFANYLILTMLFLYPTNRVLYIASFSFSTGTLGWAIVLVKNAFVLHSLDRITSCYIHFRPMIALSNLHWVTQYNKNRGWDVYDPSGDEFNLSFILYFYFVSCSIYLTWAFCYFIFIFVIRAKHIKERNYLTLFKYMRNTDKAAKKLWNSWGPQYSGFLFMLTHFVIF